MTRRREGGLTENEEKEVPELRRWHLDPGIVPDPGTGWIKRVQINFFGRPILNTLDVVSDQSSKDG
jgi:hypothetical protein